MNWMTTELQCIMKALSDPVRRSVLELLRQRGMMAGEICEHFTISAAAVSRHLSVLREADLIRDRREGKFIHYEINLSVLQEAVIWLHRFSESAQPSAIQSYVRPQP